MTRTRIVFFGVLAVFLIIIATSIAAQIIGETMLRQMFIAGTVFAVGVVALDFMGILGSSADDAGGSMEGGGDLAGDTGGDAGGDTDFAPLGDSDADSSGSTGGALSGDETGGDTRLIVEGDSGPNLVLSILTYLRFAVYFCLGFGPMGLAALLTGRSPMIALIVAIPVGIIALFLAQAFFRFQQSDTDSSVKGKELLMQEATVIIPLTHTTMGRIRLRMGMSVVEQYALAEDPDADFKRDDIVRIVRVTQDCVYVR